MTTPIGDTSITPLREPDSEPDNDTAAPTHPLSAKAQRQPAMRDTTALPSYADHASGNGRHASAYRDAVPGGRHRREADVAGAAPAAPQSPQTSPAPANPPAPPPSMDTSPGTTTTPQTPQPARPPGPLLAGATRAELQQLLDTYDKATLPNGTRLPQDAYGDQQNTARLGKELKQGLTGYPPDVQQFEQTVNDMQAQLGRLPPAEHESYAGVLATLDVAYRNGDAQGRQNVDSQLSLLGSALSMRADTADNDPVERALNVFNAPVGAGYLSEPADRQQLGALSRLRDRFVAAATPDERRASFTEAATLKNGLQQTIATALDRHTGEETGKWAQANADVDRMLHEADALAGDPGKRYELIGRQLFNTNPGSGRDDQADRRLLAFTQRMQDDPALHDKLVGWSVDAGRKLNGYGVDAQKNYLDILQNLPPAGPDYVRDLADQYNAVLHDASYKNASITPGARAEKLAGQILEGTARFLIGMTPFAPLTAAFDAHSTLPDNARVGIDMAAGLLGLVAGEGASAFAERLGAKGAGALREAGALDHSPPQADPVIPGSADAASAHTVPSTPGASGASGTAGAADTSPRTAGLSTDPAVAEASQRIGGQPARLPDDYAVHPAPGTLTPAPGQKGMLTDSGGQRYIQSGANLYATRFDADNHTWRVYRPDNPYRPQYPVRLDAQDNWQVHHDVGLKGGMDPQAGPSRGDAAAQRFAQTHRISTSTGAPPSADMLQTLDPGSWRSPADRWPDDKAFAARYEQAFDRLPAEQQQAIKNWTYLDLGDAGSSHGSSSGSSSSGSSSSPSPEPFEDVNFELNRQLNQRRHGPDTAQRAVDLQAGLDALPKPDGPNRLLRSAAVPADYAGRLAPGDYVTPSPAFMSASSGNTFAQGMLADGVPEHEGHQAFAIYDIQSRSATPFLSGVNAMAEDEREWLFTPRTLFRVEEVATAKPQDGTAPRVGIRLVEVPFDRPVYAKNIYTGEQELIYPPGATPSYTTLQPTRSPALQVPPPPSPTQAPPPAHGDPNQPGATAV